MNRYIQAYSKLILELHPELRFLQLMSIAAKEGGWTNDDLFYCPDDILIAGLKKLVDGFDPVNRFTAEDSNKKI